MLTTGKNSPVDLVPSPVVTCKIEEFPQLFGPTQKTFKGKSSIR